MGEIREVRRVTSTGLSPSGPVAPKGGARTGIDTFTKVQSGIAGIGGFVPLRLPAGLVAAATSSGDPRGIAACRKAGYLTLAACEAGRLSFVNTFEEVARG